MRYNHHPFAAILLLACLAAQTLPAQPYANEWIDFGQSYAKFAVASEGLHRISHEVLAASNLPLDAEGLQLFRNGRQVPIYVSAADPAGQLQAGDYVEFYAYPNDGAPDSLLYPVREWQPNPRMSLFTDTARYFLTSGEPAQSLRYQTIANNLGATPPPEGFFWHKEAKDFRNMYVRGRPVANSGWDYLTHDFGEMEGYASAFLDEVTPNYYFFETSAVHFDAPPGKIKVLMLGRRNEIPIWGDHRTQLSMNGTIYADFTYEGYDSYLSDYDLPMWMLTQPVSTVTVQAMWENLPDYNDRQSIAYIELEYARDFDFSGASSMSMQMPGNGERYFEVAGFDAGAQPVLYDQTNLLRLLPDTLDAGYNAYLPAGGAASTHRDLFWSNTDAGAITIVDSLEAVNFIDFSNPDEQGDYIIVSHPALMEGAVDQVQRYAQHRATPEGGGYQTIVVDIGQLYDQFAWGVTYSPLSVRNFVNYAIDHWAAEPGYLLLLGKGVAYWEVRSNPMARPLCLVPTYGDTGSDLSMVRRNSNTKLPQIAVGRVSARTPDDVRAYLDKLAAYEAYQLPGCSSLDNGWMRRTLYFTYGNGMDEVTAFGGYLQQFADTAAIQPYSGISYGPYDVYSLVTDTVVEDNVMDIMENGLGMIHYYGHSSGGDWGAYELMGFSRSDGRYPFLFSNCTFSGFASSTHFSFGEVMTLTPDYGTIGMIGHAFYSTPVYINEYDHIFYRHLTQTSIGQPVGDIINATVRDVFAPYPPDGIPEGKEIFAYGFPYSGDPAIVIGTPRLPDLEVEPLSVQVLGNTINATVVLHNNAGYSGGAMHDFRVRLLPFGTNLLLDSYAVPPPFGSDTLQLQLPWTFAEGNFTLHFAADLGDQVYEGCESNNSATVNFTAGCNDTNAIIENAGIVCSNDFPLALTADPTGGVFSSPSLAVSPDGLMDGTNAGNVGTHLVEYTYNDGVCDWYGSAEVTIPPITPLVVTANVDTAHCIETVTLTASPGFDGYIWVDGQTGQSIITCPELANENPLYGATDAFGCATFTSGQPSIVVEDSWVIANADATYCGNSGAVNLSAEPPGGSYESETVDIDGNWLYPASGAPGMHEIRFTHSGWCCSIDTVFTISITAAPQPDLGEDVLLSEGETVVLDAEVPGAESYEWSTGETSASIVAAPSPLPYSVSVTDAAGCVGTDAVWVALVDGIDNVAGKPWPLVWPNPANHSLHVGNLPHRAEVQLLNAGGKLVLQRQCTQGSCLIDVSKYAPGVYFLKVVGDAGARVVKVVLHE